MEIILATNNLHKLEEINDIAKNSGISFILPPEGYNPCETGETFAENSYIKAYGAAKLTGKYTLADDSGLCVAALNGAPGIHSARYAATREERIAKLLKELLGETDRSAKFVCCMTLVAPDGKIINQTVGECRGKIINDVRGTNGFGYDPVFIPQGYNKTLAELSDKEKNKISHRGSALIQMITFIKEFEKKTEFLES